MGKNYSGNTGRVNGTRKDSDAYPTPYSLTRLLLLSNLRARVRGRQSNRKGAGGTWVRHGIL